MTFILGLFVGAMIAGMAYLVGYGAGHTTGFLSREPEHTTVYVPTERSPEEVTRDVIATLERHRIASFGFNGTRGDALEVM